MIRSKKLIKINYLNENAREKINNLINFIEESIYDSNNSDLQKDLLKISAGSMLGLGAGTALGLHLADVDFEDFIEHPIDTSIENPIIPVSAYAGKTAGAFIAGAPYVKEFYKAYKNAYINKS